MEENMAEAMTRRDREQLCKLVRTNARVAKLYVAQREAQLLADVETKLAAEFKAEDEAWSDVVALAKEAVAQADAKVAEVSRERGVPLEFRPSVKMWWLGRGINGIEENRDELRKVAKAQIAALGARARLAIDTRAAEIQTVLIAGGLESDQARKFLEDMPTAEQLMPPLTTGELRQLLPVSYEGVDVDYP
jgi:hypothetical protein